MTLLKYWLLPPGLQLLLAVIALLMWRRYRYFSRFLLLISFTSVWLLSLPGISYRLFTELEAPYVEPVALMVQQQAQAVVVLGGGRDRNAPEYGGDQVNARALQRLRYAAVLAKRLDLPVIVTGGRVYPNDKESEAEISDALLKDEWQVKEVWLETHSRNTWENAQFTADVLKDKEIQQVLLVTHAYHMRRSQLSFEHFGVDVTPMPTAFFMSNVSHWWDDWVPRASALHYSAIALHEYLGLLQYTLRQKWASISSIALQ